MIERDGAGPSQAGVDRRRLLGGVAGLAACPTLAAAQTQPQPFFANVRNLIDRLAATGQPMAAADVASLTALAAKRDANAVAAAEEILARYTLARVLLTAEGRATASIGGAPRILVEQGWTQFLCRVENPPGLTGRFYVSAGATHPGQITRGSPGFYFEQRADLMDTVEKAPLIERLWPLAQTAEEPLSGLALEYRIIELYSRDRGERSARLGFGVGMDPAPIFGRTYTRADTSRTLALDFKVRPSREASLRIFDDDGEGCMASLEFRDQAGHVWPPQVMRLAPDMTFQPHIYRAHGETVRLPDGVYTVASRRGPEYVRTTQTVRVAGERPAISVQLQRWVDPARWGWYSGDTHIHAAGCAHYMQPTTGVSPETMIRHVRGEGLAIAQVLTWGPGWYEQKKNFSGRVVSPEATLEHPRLQAANNAVMATARTAKDAQSLLRYDIEVSGFPSSISGHLIALRLKEQDYPGAAVVEDWPSWNLPIARWAKAQGGVVGYAHIASGVGVASRDLPNYDIPPFDGVGYNEAIVDVTHDACDFLSGVNGAPIPQLNVWYHLLNCGFTVVMVGETDYPCINPSMDARPGVGRSYVKLDRRPTDDAGYDAWIENMRRGRLYWGDGRSHFLTFTVDGAVSGDTLRRDAGGRVTVKADVAAYLEPTASPETLRDIKEEPWHIEHARLAGTRNVRLELVVNGEPAGQVDLAADGKVHPVEFTAAIARSSWVALRVFRSGHTYPVFVQVGGKPIRASRRSAQWLRSCVDALWTEKHRLIRDSERPAAAEAYDHARRTYERIISESDVA